ncbi:GNAT family N-acetyltransferase [Dactylosporangium fulvum]|uniref:GNAT family N-acetyltransferase n=1 Tax=Dactylosporangium fulvum TaxID=53359 RepID=A0ABY5W5N1_9ACTN|nr:GNAT family N-acetyltransferase [Dactylosporangium fulvum]UWP84329.1 GNAT family N-acetyltransferase [Dactylosporangium fulvum]
MFELRPMTPAEYDARIPVLKREYAADEVRAGRSTPETAQERTDQLFARLLPDGLATAGQLLFSGVADGVVIGFIWLALPTPERPQAWVFDIEVDPEHRRNGYGRALMLAAEDQLRSRGVERLGLNVFGHNPNARNLYESLGFEVTSLQMSKELG